MHNRSDRRSLFFVLSVFSLVIISTYFVILFARGYRLEFKKDGPSLQVTGILSFTSKPKGGSVYLNDRLITATDDTLNLPPGSYTVKITKDGYTTWQKTYQVKKEVVYQTDAELFRSAPELRPLTLSGAINPVLSPDGSKVIFAVASASATKDNGLYLLETSDNLIPLAKTTTRQIAPNFTGTDWAKATFTFSPDSRQVVATFKNQLNYLLNIDTTITEKNLTDITSQLPQINKSWSQDELQIIKSRLNRLPPEISTLVATDSARDIAINQNDDKVFYLASKDGTIDSQTTPPPAQSSQTQDRHVAKNNFYVYDIKDDTNFAIGSSETVRNLSWLPYTNNLIYVEDNSIKIVDYDNTNKNVIYAGKFSADLVFPWSDGSRIITLTSAYTGATNNLYSISLK
ncbi:PEGA domain-containing protein [Candidatus Shapirobacteria bacterium]|nr:PEGA domain-containing protein [Candidatus Shapirobacteria bacterium]